MKFALSILLAGAVFMGAAAVPARAGCVTGAMAGAVAGHYAHHHAVMGAVAGCVAGHEIAKHRKEARLHADQLNQQQLEKMHAENGAGH